MNTENVWIVIPCYNDGGILPGVIDSLLSLGHSIVVVDDGSDEPVHALLEDKPVHCLRHIINLGQGAALQTGIDYALLQGAEIIVTFDSDGQHRAEDIQSIISPLLEGQCDATLGTRFRLAENWSEVPPLRRVVLKLATKFTRMTTGLPLTDTHNGFRAFTAQAARQLCITQNRMAHASEILQQIASARMRVQEVDVKIRYTKYSLGKGQSLLNALNIMLDILRSKIR